jgi:hypothetical protein
MIGDWFSLEGFRRAFPNHLSRFVHDRPVQQHRISYLPPDICYLLSAICYWFPR